MNWITIVIAAHLLGGQPLPLAPEQDSAPLDAAHYSLSQGEAR